MRAAAPPFPFEAVRDLVGVLRALFAWAKSRPDPHRRTMTVITSIARELRAAERLAAKDPVRAIERAERAVLRLDELSPLLLQVDEVLDVAGRRVRRKPEALPRGVTKWAVGSRR
jgi:hypothetical protein